MNGVVRVVSAWGLVVSLLFAPAMQAKDASAKPMVVEHTYWVKPGRALQFITLYKRSEVPKLDAWVAAGKLRGYRITQPQFMAGNDQWDYRITLFWRDAESAIEAASQDLSRRKADSNDRYEDQMMLELVVDHNEVIVRETEKGVTDN